MWGSHEVGADGNYGEYLDLEGDIKKLAPRCETGEIGHYLFERSLATAVEKVLLGSKPGD